MEENYIIQFKKEHNQYYAEYIEQSIMHLLDKNYVIDVDFIFPKQDKIIMDKHASLLLPFFKQYKEVIYTGRKTKKAIADFICDNQTVELKYVSRGNGTYFNTSENYFKNVLGYSTSLKEEYQKICPKTKEEENIFRTNYVKNVYNFLDKNHLFYQFYYDMFTKYSKTDSPDIIIVFNHLKENYKIISPELKYSIHKPILKDKSIVFEDIRIQIGWQNGIGRNPTLRTFLK